MHPGCQLCGPCRVDHCNTIQNVTQIPRQHYGIIGIAATNANQRKCSTMNVWCAFSRDSAASRATGQSCAAALQLTAGDHLLQITARTRRLQLQQATSEFLVLIGSPLTAFGIAFDDCCFRWHNSNRSDRTFTGELQR